MREQKPNGLLRVFWQKFNVILLRFYAYCSLFLETLVEDNEIVGARGVDISC